MNELRRRAQPWLGTLVSIDAVVDGNPCNTDAAIERAFAAVARVHRAMSPAEPCSDVARFNAASGGALVTCDPWTIRVLRLAAHLQRASNGLFDVARGNTGDAYRIVGARSVIKVDPCSQLDLGGIAKGYAVDRAVATLRAAGIKAGVVNAGGDLRVFGERCWPIVLRDSTTRFTLRRGAIATSQYRHGRSPFHDDALIEPVSGYVHRIDRTITVAAPRCVVADALTKIVALSGDAHHPVVRGLGAQAWLR